MTHNGSGDDIPGAPQWVNEFLGRVDSRLEVLMACVNDRLDEAIGDLQLATGELRTLRPRVAELEEWRTQITQEVVELKSIVRKSLTPPGGMPAVKSTPPDEVA